MKKTTNKKCNRVTLEKGKTNKKRKGNTTKKVVFSVFVLNFFFLVYRLLFILYFFNLTVSKATKDPTHGAINNFACFILANCN